jgi:catechol 2,3-dioxygenase-like lactoylglutathione lyase family enzyme
MSIVLDHTIVPCTDKVKAAQFLATLLDLEYLGLVGPFAAVRINGDLTFDFDDTEPFEPHHYAFRLDHQRFEAVLARLKSAEIPFGSGPEAGFDSQLYQGEGQEGCYFADANRHVYEIIRER